MRHDRPVQHSACSAHGSVIIRHWERQVPVVPQNPAQHSKSIVQVAPDAMHASGRQSPETQAPVQQSFVPLHAPPPCRHVEERHTPPAHVPPVQQSPPETQPPPGIEHVLPNASHWPFTQLPEQHSAGFTQASPPAAQVQAPSRHSPLQHSFDDSQPSTSGRHRARHNPPRHSPLQQSVFDEQVEPSSTQVGAFIVVPQPTSRTPSHITREDMAGTVARAPRPTPSLLVGAAAKGPVRAPKPRLSALARKVQTSRVFMTVSRTGGTIRGRE